MASETDIARAARIDYLEATMLMFVRELIGKHDVAFPLAIKELADIARNPAAPSDPSGYTPPTTDKAT